MDGMDASDRLDASGGMDGIDWMDGMAVCGDGGMRRAGGGS
jgi:hypothetical protein